MISTGRFLHWLAATALVFGVTTASAQGWVGTWATAPVGNDNHREVGVEDETLRQIVHVSLGGTTFRLRISNEFGTEPLRIGAASAGLSAKGGVVGAAKAVTFDGGPSITIPPGAYVLSDSVALAVPALSDMAVDLFVPVQSIKQVTNHGEALQTNYIATGNQVGAKTLDKPKESTKWYFLKGVDVKANGGAIVAFGDSITDGHRSTVGANMRWPDVLAARLQKDKRTAGFGVLNEGISGNRLLRDLGGVNALERFDRDVLGQAGVKYLIILEGINDIGHVDRPAFPGDTVTAPELTFVLGQMIERAHAHGIKVLGATLTPYPGGPDAALKEKELALEKAENEWIETSGRFDGVIDFYTTTRDPEKTEKFLPADDSGDHLHPGDAGYKAMGESIDLKLFKQ
jgi:lysophospholipase L1-like esterase